MATSSSGRSSRRGLSWSGGMGRSASRGTQSGGSALVSKVSRGSGLFKSRGVRSAASPIACAAITAISSCSPISVLISPSSSASVGPTVGVSRLATTGCISGSDAASRASISIGVSVSGLGVDPSPRPSMAICEVSQGGVCTRAGLTTTSSGGVSSLAKRPTSGRSRETGGSGRATAMASSRLTVVSSTSNVSGIFATTAPSISRSGR